MEIYFIDSVSSEFFAYLLVNSIIDRHLFLNLSLIESAYWEQSSILDEIWIISDLQVLNLLVTVFLSSYIFPLFFE